MDIVQLNVKCLSLFKSLVQLNGKDFIPVSQEFLQTYLRNFCFIFLQVTGNFLIVSRLGTASPGLISCLPSQEHSAHSVESKISFFYYLFQLKPSKLIDGQAKGNKDNREMDR